MCEGVCLCSCQLAKRGRGSGGRVLQKRCITSKWIHRLAQDLVERLVMSQRTAD